VVRKAIEAANGINGKTIAVIGCGALGLTAATTAQRAGFRTIYAKERPPFVRSSWATGSWTPDSRIALTSAASPDQRSGADRDQDAEDRSSRRCVPRRPRIHSRASCPAR
jgi:glycine/D-amino acid oxidase-like deaminating enzyme